MHIHSAVNIIEKKMCSSAFNPPSRNHRASVSLGCSWPCCWFTCFPSLARFWEKFTTITILEMLVVQLSNHQKLTKKNGHTYHFLLFVSYFQVGLKKNVDCCCPIFPTHWQIGNDIINVFHLTCHCCHCCSQQVYAVCSSKSGSTSYTV